MTVLEGVIVGGLLSSLGMNLFCFRLIKKTNSSLRRNYRSTLRYVDSRRNQSSRDINTLVEVLMKNKILKRVNQNQSGMISDFDD